MELGQTQKHRKTMLSRMVRCFFVCFCVVPCSAAEPFRFQTEFQPDDPLPFRRSFDCDDCVCRGQQGLSSRFFSGNFFSSTGTEKQDLSSSRAIASLSSQQRRIRVWSRFFGNWTQIGDSLRELDAKTYGIALGIDRQVDRTFLFGFGLGGNWTKADVAGISRQDDLSALYGSIYCRKTIRRFFFDLEGGMGYADKAMLQEKPAYQGHFNGEFGTWWENGLAKIEPYGGFRYVYYDDSRRSESKATALIGARYSWKTVGELATTVPRLYAGMLYELGDRNLINSALFVDSPIVYPFSGFQVPQTRFYIGGGFTSSMGSSLDIYLRYTAEIASNYTSHTALIGMNWNF